MARLVGNRVVEKTPRAVEELEARCFGKKEKEGLVLFPEEALYLLSAKKISVQHEGKRLSSQQLFEKLSAKDAELQERLAVFTHLRERGFVARPSAASGFHFRVWQRGQRPGESPSSWLVSIVREGDRFYIRELVRSTRLATGLRKKLVLALVDRKGQVFFYEIKQTRF